MPPETSDREIFADLPGKKRQGKNGKGGKRKMEKKRRKIVKGKEREGGITFQNEENLFWGYQNGNFLPGKIISRREKNQEK